MVTAVAAAAAATVAYFLWLRAPEQPPGPEPILTQEARNYLPNLDLSEVSMGARETFLGQTLVTIQGNITNNGGQTVRRAEVNCVFRDPHGVEIGRERVTIVGPDTGPLEPGETQPFRMAFDTPPERWNQMMPDLFIAQIVFE